jgi:hypothetical protein
MLTGCMILLKKKLIEEPTPRRRFCERRRRRSKLFLAPDIVEGIIEGRPTPGFGSCCGRSQSSGRNRASKCYELPFTSLLESA